MTKNQIFKRIIALGKMQGSHSGSPIIASDLVQQDNLYAFQEAITASLADVGNDREVNGAELLAKEFPFLFKATKVQ